MFLMKANNHGLYLPKNCYSLLVFRINLDFFKIHKFTKTCKKLFHEKYVKKLVYKEK